jgi:hypothetical protein
MDTIEIEIGELNGYSCRKVAESEDELTYVSLGGSNRHGDDYGVAIVSMDDFGLYVVGRDEFYDEIKALRAAAKAKDPNLGLESNPASIEQYRSVAIKHVLAWYSKRPKEFLDLLSRVHMVGVCEGRIQARKQIREALGVFENAVDSAY